MNKVEAQAKLMALEHENRLLKERIEELKDERNNLRVRLDKAFDALVAKEAPAAYADNKADESEIAKTPEEIEKEERLRKIAKTNAQLLNEIEQPLFTDVDDMQAILIGKLGVPKGQPGAYEDES